MDIEMEADMANTRRVFLHSSAALVAGLAGGAASGRALAQAPSGVPAPKGKADHIDVAWFQKVLAEDTERSLKTLVTPTGFLGRVGGQPDRRGAAPTDRGGQRKGTTGMGMGSPTGQGRNMTVLAAGYDVTHKQEFKDALAKAADFVINHMWDKQYGGLYAGVDPSGKVVNDRKESYGTAAAILGMARAAQVTGKKEHADAALGIWTDMKKGLRDKYGFFKRETSRDFKVTGSGKNTQNPMMHLFEGLLGLYDATKSKEVFQDAQAHANNVIARLLQKQGYIPELYDADWKPIPAGPPGQREPDGSPLDIYNAYSEAAQTGHIEVGHQVEWAFFLSRAVERGFPRKYLGTAERLIDFVLKVGFDRETGGFFGYSDYDGKRTQASSTGGWQIDEFIKMLMHWAVVRGRQDLWGPFDKSLAAVKNTIPLPGGYHGDCMYVEALRLAALKS
jgi:cellobiose epimerase